MKAMIFAAGLGTRLKPFTDSHPKALLPLAGKTLLQWQIERLRAAGITDIVVNVHHFADQIANYLAEQHNFGCSIVLSDERAQLLETGGGLYHARPLLAGDEPILVCNVDILSTMDILAFCRAYRSEDLGLLVVSRRQTQRYLLFDADRRLSGWTNIATGALRPSSLQTADGLTPLAFSGMQLLSPRIFDAMESVVAERGAVFSLIDLYLDLCAAHRFSAYIPKDSRMIDVGKINQLSEAESFATSLLVPAPSSDNS